MIVTVKHYLHVFFLFFFLFLFLFCFRGGGMAKDFCEILMNCDLTRGGRI